MPAGRPLKFSTPEELEKKINEYFKHCDKGRIVKIINKRGEQVEYMQATPYTMEGLAIWLDCDAQTIRNYGKREEFFCTLSRARDRIHNNWIELGLLNQFNPKIVNLCLSASCKDYRINADKNVNVMVSIEDKLRKAIERSKKALIEHGQPEQIEQDEFIDI